jgi:hypothetical protein
VVAAVLTRIWSIRTTGKDAGQVKPKPSPATFWADCICAPMSREAVQKPALGFTRTDPRWAT